MAKPRAVCVYCGANAGLDPTFLTAARRLGALLARNGIDLIYGGGRLGLMGATAEAALGAGGRVTGIIPDFLKEIEVQFEDVTELIVTRSMHERKQLMFDRADAFVALPGGIGTLEETIEMLTWAQLGRHEKPILVVNLHDYWTPLLQLFDHMVEQNFVGPNVHGLWAAVTDIDAVIPTLHAKCRPPEQARPETGPSVF